MNGQLMNCNTYENRKIVEQYVADFNPYESRDSIEIDLLALTRYAKKLGKKLNELDQNELNEFKKHI